MLGKMHLVGLGTPVDEAMALKWFSLAAEQGNPGGQLGLGGLYRDGRGVSRDSREARDWMSKAATFRRYIPGSFAEKQMKEAKAALVDLYAEHFCCMSWDYDKPREWCYEHSGEESGRWGHDWDSSRVCRRCGKGALWIA